MRSSNAGRPLRKNARKAHDFGRSPRDVCILIIRRASEVGRDDDERDGRREDQQADELMKKEER